MDDMATVSENLQIIKNSTAAMKQAITDKGGIINGDITTWANSITNIPSSGEKPVIDEKDVNFYDYDGTVLYAYTKDEFLALSDLPPLPTQPGLICQGWNWDYEKAINYVINHGILNVGATYITDDGKTRFYINIDSEYKKVVLYLKLNNAEITIDWGDGNTTTTNTNCSGGNNGTHVYEFCGNYCITITVNRGTLLLGYYNSDAGVFGYLGMMYSCPEILHKVELGNNLNSTISRESFKLCIFLSTITIPNYITTDTGNVFTDCVSLKAIVYPINYNLMYSTNNCASLKYAILGSNMSNYLFGGFSNCLLYSITIPDLCSLINAGFNSSKLLYISLPSTLSKIPNKMFYLCNFLKYLSIPSSVTSIGSEAFYLCISMTFYDFSNHISVPTLSNTNAFSSIPSDCKIIVPDNLYDTWIAATNWSTYASYIIKKSDWDSLQN